MPTELIIDQEGLNEDTSWKSVIQECQDMILGGHALISYVADPTMRDVDFERYGDFCDREIQVHLRVDPSGTKVGDKSFFSGPTISHKQIFKILSKFLGMSVTRI